MMKNRLNSNNSLSSETASVSVQFQCIFLPEKKNTYAYRHSIYYINVIERLRRKLLAKEF